MTVTVKNKTPLLVPMAVQRRVDGEYTPEQRRVLDAALAEGLADIEAGRIRGPFSSHAEFIASLHKEARKLNRAKAKRSA